MLINPDFIYGVTPGDIVYDIETYPNIFTIGLEHTVTHQRWYFEISFRRNDLDALTQFMSICKQQGCRWVGYNNLGFDYPVMHTIYQSRNLILTAGDIYNKAMSIINAPHNARFAHMVWESDWVVDQLDLFKVHHFDNQARSTSLKMLEFNMRMDSIQDLPFDVGLELNNEQADVLVDYMWHDIKATCDFYNESKDQIRFREELTQKYNRNFMNHNDTKIGKDYFIMELEKHSPGCCYAYVDGKKHIQQTPRDSINLGDVILPYVQFEHPEFQRIHNWFKSQTITETKGAIKDVNCSIDGFQFDFGTGGIHGSIESQVVHSDEDWIIEDWDVASYYPNLAIKNSLAPAHLGDTFCTIYEDVYNQRKGHAKGTAENAMLKLALNGVYGDSNSKYSPFYDPQFTMSITINGQLLLCMLAENLLKCADVKMIQINTDGLTIRYPRQYKDWVHSVCKWWEGLTKLELEDVEYKRMFIRDVNNYIGEYTDGKVKRKGAYEHDLGWHQNHSNLVVPKAAEAALVHGKDVREFIENHGDIMDFMLRTKVPRSSKLFFGEEQIQNITRYYISKDGDTLRKVMPATGPIGQYKRASRIPDDYFNQITTEVGEGVWDERIHTKNKSVYEDRISDVNTGYTVMVANNMGSLPCDKSEKFIKDRYFSDINIDWYVREAEKLVNPLIDGTY